MLGVPAPGVEATVLDQGAAPWRTIEQAGWKLTYDSFAVVAGLNLPKRISAARGVLRVKVIVDEWEPRAPVSGGKARQ
jgi:outer membrane biogenesis lipoprotein LolB